MEYQMIQRLMSLAGEAVELLKGVRGDLAKILEELKKPTAAAEVVSALNNRYRVYSFDLSTARDNVPLGLRDIGVVANSATVAKLESSAYWRRNDPVTGDLEELYTGYRVENFQIEELYISNPEGTGKLIIVVEWRE
jgi:hypothetical protein